MNVTFVVRVCDAENNTIGAYSKREKLAIIPTIGMKVRSRPGNSIWKTTEGNDIDPVVKEVVYNIDDREIYCLFEIDQFLSSGYWVKIRNLNKNYELQQFNLHTKPVAEAVVKPQAAGVSAVNSVMMMVINILIPLSMMFSCAVQNVLVEGIL